MIKVDGAVLMSTRQYASEEKLAALGCAHIEGKPGARVLTGGLGFGYTLRAVLSRVAPDATVVVAEISPAVIAWNRNPAFHLAFDAMADPRVTVLAQDVGDAIARHPGEYDSIVIDVDNGPEGLSGGGNDPLYNLTGLKHARRALKTGGRLAIWSAAPDAAFEKLMSNAGFVVEVHRCRAHANSGRRHYLFLGWAAG
jgi:spermidine synthase